MPATKKPSVKKTSVTAPTKKPVTKKATEKATATRTSPVAKKVVADKDSHKKQNYNTNKSQKKTFNSLSFPIQVAILLSVMLSTILFYSFFGETVFSLNSPVYKTTNHLQNNRNNNTIKTKKSAVIAPQNNKQNNPAVLSNSPKRQITQYLNIPINKTRNSQQIQDQNQNFGSPNIANNRDHYPQNQNRWRSPNRAYGMPPPWHNNSNRGWNNYGGGYSRPNYYSNPYNAPRR